MAVLRQRLFDNLIQSWWAIGRIPHVRDFFTELRRAVWNRKYATSGGLETPLQEVALQYPIPLPGRDS